MSGPRSVIAAVALALAVGLGWGPVASADLIVNGGFETGDFTGFTLSGETIASGVDMSHPFQGAYAAFFGTNGDGGTVVISQLIPTNVGNSYTLSFALMNEPTQGLPQSNEVAVTFGSQTTDMTNVPAFGYTIMTIKAVATSTQTLVQFTFRNDNSFFDLDRISVVPEPASLALLGVGAAVVLVGGRRRASRRRRSPG